MTLPTDVITKEIVEQYETIRANGACNMLDRRCVQMVADLAGFHGLASLTKKEYPLTWSNYSGLMEHYGVRRLEATAPTHEEMEQMEWEASMVGGYDGWDEDASNREYPKSTST